MTKRKTTAASEPENVEPIEPENVDETTTPGATIDDDTRPPAPETTVGAALDPKLVEVLATITGETAFEIDHAYKTAWTTLTVDGKRPPADVVQRLMETQRKAHERIVTTTRKPRGARAEQQPKGEFKPFVQSVLDWMTQHYAEHGASAGLRVKDIADGMSKHAGTVTHAVRELVEARRLRPSPNESKRYTLFANRAENVPADVSTTTGERAATATTTSKPAAPKSTKSKTTASAAAA